MSALLFYTLFYLLMSGCIVYPPTEFILIGLTVKDIFARFLGSENEVFVQYHIRRSIITLLVHSMLPLGNDRLDLDCLDCDKYKNCSYINFCSVYPGYVTGLIYFGHMDAAKLLTGENFLGLLFLVYVIVGPLYLLHEMFEWFLHNWSLHPIARNLAVYCNSSDASWKSVASDINTEYRRFIQVSRLYLGT